VLWLPSEDRETVQAVDPELQQTAEERGPVQNLTDRRIRRLNLPYSSMSEQQIRSADTPVGQNG
jgi:hypothetical protein